MEERRKETSAGILTLLILSKLGWRRPRSSKLTRGTLLPECGSPTPLELTALAVLSQIGVCRGYSSTKGAWNALTARSLRGVIFPGHWQHCVPKDTKGQGPGRQSGLAWGTAERDRGCPAQPLLLPILQVRKIFSLCIWGKKGTSMSVLPELSRCTGHDGCPICVLQHLGQGPLLPRCSCSLLYSWWRESKGMSPPPRFPPPTQALPALSPLIWWLPCVVAHLCCREDPVAVPEIPQLGGLHFLGYHSRPWWETTCSSV